jgi:hypothetical protein
MAAPALKPSLSKRAARGSATNAAAGLTNATRQGMAKTGKKNSTRRHARTIDKAAVINRCVEIIAPDPDRPQDACRQHISKTLDILASDKPKYDGVDLIMIVHALGYAAMVMETSHLWWLLSDKADRDDPWQSLDKDSSSAWTELTHRIAFIVQRAKEELAARAAAQPRRQTRPPDDFRRYCALFAFELISMFGTKRPTLTDGGPFYRLAAVLHAATIGGDLWKEDGLERACRAVFAQRGRR